MSEGDKTIRVMIVDDHDMVRRGLSVLLDTFDDLELVGQASDGDEAITICHEVQPDVILMDMMMPHTDGVTAVRVIHEQYPDIKIIALTNYKENELIQNVLEAGAISFLLKNVLIDELAVAIRAAYSGKSMFTPEAAQVLIEAATRPPEPGFDLTAREREVLSLMVEGLSNREIADQLIIGQSTVKNHVSNILSKLNASNRVEAVTMAIEHRLLD